MKCVRQPIIWNDELKTTILYDHAKNQSTGHSENAKNGYKLKILQNNILPLHNSVRYLLKDSTTVLFSESATTGTSPDRSSTQIVMAEVSILNWSLKIESNLNKIDVSSSQKINMLYKCSYFRRQMSLCTRRWTKIFQSFHQTSNLPPRL